MLSNIRICNLANATPDQLEQTAAMLHLAFRAVGTAACAIKPVKINRFVTLLGGCVVGWIGAIHEDFSVAGVH